MFKQEKEGVWVHNFRGDYNCDVTRKSITGFLLTLQLKHYHEDNPKEIIDYHFFSDILCDYDNLEKQFKTKNGNFKFYWGCDWRYTWYWDNRNYADPCIHVYGVDVDNSTKTVTVFKINSKTL